MKIRTKLVIFFLVTAFAPVVTMVVILLLGGEGIRWVLLAFLFSAPIAVILALVVAGSFSQALEELTIKMRDVAAGTSRVEVSADTYEVSQEFGKLAEQFALIANAVSNMRNELETQLSMREQERDAAVTELATIKEQVERMDAITIDRESRMIELKLALKDALERLGEEMQPLPTADESAQTDVNVDSGDSRVVMLNVLEDLREEKMLLATEKAKDDAILRSIGDGLAVANASGRITFMNDIAKSLLGLTSVDMHTDIWTRVQGLLDPATNKPISPEDMPLQKAIQTRTVQKQKLLIKNDATPEGRYLSMTATPIMVAGLPMGSVATFHDMTKEQQIDRAKTEFVSLASHQLRTPLSTINWYAEMLLAGDAGELNDEQRKYLEEVYQGNQRMVDLINSLLNVSRLELGTFAVDPEDTDVIALAQSVIDEQMPQVTQRNIALTANLVPTTPHLYADPKLLRMVLQNLLSNAVKYTPIGGTVAVHVGIEGTNISIQVADTGLGIPKGEQDRIFSKLYRATNARESDTDGTGLGLYIVKSVVENSGGMIRFESEEGKGTTFYVLLPKTGMHKKEGTKSLA